MAGTAQQTMNNATSFFAAFFPKIVRDVLGLKHVV